MPPRQQFSTAQRNFLAFEYHKRKGPRDFVAGLVQDFQEKFPAARRPGKNQIRRIWEKQMNKGTVNKCNSKSSPGLTFSGRPRTQRTPPTIASVKGVMDRDAAKEIGDATVSPISSARRNVLAIAKSSWSRIKLELRYHPYKPVRRHELKPGDPARRMVFCQWIVTLSDLELQEFLFSDEANFLVSGNVNSQNVRRYAPLKVSDPVNGGRPDHFVVDKPTFSQKLMVFCGVNRDGTFGLKFYRNMAMDGPSYHSLLQYHVMPRLRQWNGGDLDRLVWTQDGAPCHVTDQNMRYLDRQFGDKVVSRKPIRGRDWPARSPDLNPCDYFLWGFLKSKVYTPRPNTLDQLQANIEREVAALDPQMIRRALMDIRVRAHKCKVNNGGHVE